jgi:hypothetical protein
MLVFVTIVFEIMVDQLDSPSKRLPIKTEATMALDLKRGADGTIKNGATPICLRGGHFHLFQGVGLPIKAYYKENDETPFQKQIANPKACAYTVVEAAPQYWDNNPWTALFTKMRDTGCNLLRVWLTNGSAMVSSKPTDITPFVLFQNGNTWKWEVQEAVEDDQWNTAFFNRLKNFVQKANAYDIAIQISLFNYSDLDDFTSATEDYWTMSFYNPLNCKGATQDWANLHLVKPSSGGTKERHEFFTNPTNQLNVVQEAFVRKTVKTLMNAGNVIFEIMNEPRSASQGLSAKFASKIAGWIISEAGTWRPLISMNVSEITRDPDINLQVGDIDWWKSHQDVLNYDEIDILSYHGLTGYWDILQTICLDNPNRKDTQFPTSYVDLQSISIRRNSHDRDFPNKALMYCTDAVKAGPHEFDVRFSTGGSESVITIHKLQFRDGQFTTGYPNFKVEGEQDSPEEQRRNADLKNWATWVLWHGKLIPGKVHFQNHSMNASTFDRIKSAWDTPQPGPVNPPDDPPSNTWSCYGKASVLAAFFALLAILCMV